MPPSGKVTQPARFAAFRCVGAECEDNCCGFWRVMVDKPAHDRFRSCSDPQLKPLLDEFVTINTNDPSDENFARINFAGTGATCPFLSESLCSMHTRFGEDFLANICATYPRLQTRVDGVLEKSLDLSCPEAARLALLNPEPMTFVDGDASQDAPPRGLMPMLDTANPARPSAPYKYFHEVRSRVVSLLQHRAQPLWKRLLIVGLLCDKLEAIGSGEEQDQIPNLLASYAGAVQTRVFDAILNALRVEPAAQLDLVRELIDLRLSAEPVGPRFLQCHREFSEGIQQGYAQAFSAYYQPFMSRHEHILEHYLVNYCWRNLFPFGQEDDAVHKWSVHRSDQSIRAEYTLMTAYYAIVRAVLVGMAGLYKAEFGEAHVIRGIQSFAKGFEHSLHFGDKAIRLLKDKGMVSAQSLAVLVLDSPPA